MNCFKYIIGALALTACIACTDREAQAEAERQRAINNATRDQLAQAVGERDELIALLTEISSGMDDIKSVEQIVSINNEGEIANNRDKINADLNAIRSSLAERRQKLADLEQRLRNSNVKNQNLLTTIETLKNQLASQSAEIESLSTRLTQANDRIAALDQTVDSLNTAVDIVTGERDAANAEAQRQEVLANAVYYCIGSNAELKAHNIIEGGGFLKKTKVLQGDFDREYFTQADKRTVTEIPVYARKAKILGSNHPEGSYSFVESNGQTVLHITNPAAFWSVSNILVIQTD